MKKKILSIITIIAISFSAISQDGFELALLGTSKDASKLIKAYFNPGIEGLMSSMNNGWYHTAKTHKKFGFDLSIGLNAAFLDKKHETFNINELRMTSISSSATTASTFAGPNKPTNYTVTLKNIELKAPNGTVITRDIQGSFKFPGGVTADLPMKAVPGPAVQLAVGLPFKMDVIVRYFPETKFGKDDGKASMYGIGLKKEITSWFGPIEKTPLHVSLLAAYTSLDLTYTLNNQVTGALEVQSGLAKFDMSAFTVQAIASLNFPIINFYGGIGYSNGNADLKMDGNFSYTYNEQTVRYKKAITPPSLNFKSSGFRTTVGTRLSLGFFKIFADYTLQKYNTANVGIAFSFR